MKAPFLGTNNGRYNVRAVEHGLSAKLDRGAPGAVIAPYNGPVTLTLHHKTARGWGGYPAKGHASYGPVTTKPVEPEEPRVLCQVPGKELPRSRNEQSRTYHWPLRYPSGSNEHPSCPAMMTQGSTGRAVLRIDGKGKQIRRKLKESKLNWQSGEASSMRLDPSCIVKGGSQ